MEYTDGGVALIEVKGANMIDSETVQRKREAAERWCKRREMEYSYSDHPVEGMERVPA